MLKLWNPAVFQGNLHRSGYFEGWYFKHVSPGDETAFAVIPGISLAKDKGQSHAFIQVFDAKAKESHYFTYPVHDFRADEKKFDVTIAKNSFTLERMLLDIERDGVQIKADLKYRNTHPWPVSLLSPGAMGWYAFVPRMECYHDVLSFNNTLIGYVQTGGDRKDFTGGKGYIEKDWGTSMPHSWIWMQTNHFPEDEASFFGSIAKIPWLRRSFTGFLFGFYLKNRIYRFTTYTGARIKELHIDDERLTFTVEDARCGLKVEGKRAEGGRLVAPKMGEMTVKINQTLSSTIGLTFYRKKGGEILFAGTGRNAGLEYVGDVDELVKGLT